MRKHIYQLYELINHLNAFGSEYLKPLLADGREGGGVGVMPPLRDARVVVSAGVAANVLDRLLATPQHGSSRRSGHKRSTDA